MKDQLCGSVEEMIVTVDQATQMGWTVAMNESSIEFTRLDGVSFLWNWVPDLMQFCMVAQHMI